MYKRLALFSSELFENASNDPELMKDVEFQMNKLCDDEVEVDENFEDENFNANSIGDNNYSSNLYESNDNFIGKFKCILCPNKVLLSDLDLEKHLKSKCHLKMIKKWSDKQKESEYIRKKFNQYHGICNYDEKEIHMRTDDEISVSPVGSENLILKSKRRRKKSSNHLTEEQIKSRKIKFKRKKERRLIRKLEIK
ncbi:hypothetical protein FG386_003201 [Cryptosporidium ryanae]|uniref:uncharacterized protein n=1 Tax=Cryptosporidium ryanae TaxID=515981 RepID=UPI00351A48D1|nr:hypothetical protein FG386_003201 [Cryptosporidium ryanae]